ncbi:hypothetical protein C3L23_07945 [Nautilia sp. PV-1]|uniref:GGDEF domain-containing protein n=1 Tax=Nautilia sp. PV-1 TaxID=2579250 RepID=UPI000FDBC787|nr:GGDEF domain-containing protein [Nautilia sp. PV-1]AZV47207.1 hypothetical protein C3L23_07945 [Nautilia sp. PV-1]
MSSIEIFKKETVKVPLILYLLILVFYKLSDVYGLVFINPFVEKYTLFAIVSLVLLYFLYLKDKLSYNLFIVFFIIAVGLNLHFVIYFQTHVVYRTMWIIALIPFVYLYAGRKVGTFFSVYFLLFVVVSYFNGLFKDITLQDLFVYIFSNLLVASISYFFVLNLEKYTVKIVKENKDLETEANTDALTGVYNRRGFFKAIENRKGILGLFDLDNFKKINDQYGHKFGDEYLNYFVDVLKENTRKNDIIGRIGGDEFVVLFENSEMTDIKKWAIKLYRELDSKKFKNEKISVSSGFSEYKGDLKESFMEADKKLYMSKKVKNTFTF